VWHSAVSIWIGGRAGVGRISDVGRCRSGRSIVNFVAAEGGTHRQRDPPRINFQPTSACVVSGRDAPAPILWGARCFSAPLRKRRPRRGRIRPSRRRTTCQTPVGEQLSARSSQPAARLGGRARSMRFSLMRRLSSAVGLESCWRRRVSERSNRGVKWGPAILLVIAKGGVGFDGAQHSARFRAILIRLGP